MDRRLLRENQLTAAIKYCQTLPSDSVCTDEGLNGACGVGVEVKVDEITSFLDNLVAPDVETIKTERYTFPFHSLIYKVQEHERLKWADGKLVTSELESLKLRLLGPQTEADLEMLKEKKTKGKKKDTGDSAAKKESTSVDPRTDSTFEARDLKAAQNRSGLLFHVSLSFFFWLLIFSSYLLYIVKHFLKHMLKLLKV